MPPARDDGRERPILGAELAHANLERRGDLLLGAAADAAFRQLRICLVGDLGRRPHRLDLAALLDLAQRLDDPARAHQLGPVTQRILQATVSAHAERLVFEAGAPVEPGSHVSEQIAAGPNPVELRHLRRCLLDVAEVREEEADLGADHGCPVRAGEARGPAQVRQVRDQQRIEPLLTNRSREAGRAGAHRLPSNSRARIWSASRYPSAPLPDTRPTQRSAITEWRRHSSRWSTAERCTSTAGRRAISSASRIAYE